MMIGRVLGLLAGITLCAGSALAKVSPAPVKWGFRDCKIATQNVKPVQDGTEFDLLTNRGATTLEISHRVTTDNCLKGTVSGMIEQSLDPKKPSRLAIFEDLKGGARGCPPTPCQYRFVSKVPLLPGAWKVTLTLRRDGKAKFLQEKSYEVKGTSPAKR